MSQSNKKSKYWFYFFIIIVSFGFMMTVFAYIHFNKPVQDTIPIEECTSSLTPEKPVEPAKPVEQLPPPGDEEQPAPPQPQKPQPVVSNVEPSGFYNTVWGSDHQHIFIGGNDGKIILYNGGKIEQLDNEYTNRIRKIRGISSNEVYAGCDDGLLLKFDGFKWEKFKKFPDENRIFALQVFKENGKTIIFAGGDYGDAYIYNGSEWKNTTTGAGTRIWNFWGTKSDNIYAATYNYCDFYHYNGKEWKKISLPESKTHFYCVVGSGDNDLYLAGTSGHIQHFDGTKWTDLREQIGTNWSKDFICSGWYCDPEHIYFLSYKGRVVLWDSVAKTSKQYDAGIFQSEIWADGKGFFITAGGDGSLYVSNPKTGIERLKYGNPKKPFKEQTDVKLTAIPNHDKPVIFKAKDGWKAVDLVEKDFVGVWGSSPDNYYAVGNAGRIFHFNGSFWKQMKSPTDYSLYSVRGTDASHIYICGVLGTFLRFDGKTWCSINTNTKEDLSGVSCPTPDCVFICGYNGTILKYYKEKVEKIELEKKYRHFNFSDIWAFSNTEAYVVGDQGSIFHIKGSSITKIDSGTNKWLLCLWAADKNKIFIGVEDGIILLLSDGTIKRMDAGIPMCVFGLWGTSDTNVYGVSGDGGKIIHYDGSIWKPVAVADDYLCDIWGVKDDIIFAVGAGKN